MTKFKLKSRKDDSSSESDTESDSFDFRRIKRKSKTLIQKPYTETPKRVIIDPTKRKKQK